jgi:catechol 2,3-dioxygenase-like lactoylglutathione lyase family enzyme
LLAMRFKFGYTGIRVRDLDKAIQFFTSVLGMKLQGRIKAPLNKREFANLLTLDEKHWLEINWYADDSPVAGSTGTQMNFGATMHRLWIA